jgi:hypothetical protein
MEADDLPKAVSLLLLTNPVVHRSLGPYLP